MIMVNQNILILRPKFNIFWAIFIRLFLTFNTSATEEINQYQQIVIALTEILGLMQEIDRIIPGFPIE
ncbi:MAG: hypothetical protein AN483_16860 [Aphanizomenon flos-aquae MDT14a]|jgi:hypothetical protein|uniref:Uncharacterized protein n=1 Tax=Aphanizomenon flos-aquae LD13 TaxID=1710894 RepID=A0A1B7VPQ5_APHFL|nr:MAG: hypothetical protein AN481_15675 [Aphanizomenon flos-aquae LD13]OBQ28237.1 MAG: hypothetical protein AN483_16860 [Aphanizomenon flos-aquae MDT14a]